MQARKDHFAKKKRVADDAGADNTDAIATRVAALLTQQQQSGSGASGSGGLPPSGSDAPSADGGQVVLRRKAKPVQIVFRHHEYEAVLDSIGRAARSARHAEKLREAACTSFQAEASALEVARGHLANQAYQAQQQ